MEYLQHNRIPIPASGAFESVGATIESVFDWQYALEQKGLLALYEKGKANNWNATELDWSADVDIERIMQQRTSAGGGAIISQVMAPPVALGEKGMVELQLNMNAFMLSQFLHGECATWWMAASAKWKCRSKASGRVRRKRLSSAGCFFSIRQGWRARHVGTRNTHRVRTAR